MELSFNKGKEKNLTLREVLLNFANNQDFHKFLSEASQKLQIDIHQKGPFWHSRMQLIIIAEIDGYLSHNRGHIEQVIKAIKKRVQKYHEIYQKLSITCDKIKQKDITLFNYYLQFGQIYHRRIYLIESYQDALIKTLTLFESAKRELKTEGTEPVRLNAESHALYLFQQIIEKVKGMINYSNELNNLHYIMQRKLYEVKMHRRQHVKNHQS